MVESQVTQRRMVSSMEETVTSSSIHIREDRSSTPGESGRPVLIFSIRLIRWLVGWMGGGREGLIPILPVAGRGLAAL